MKIENEFIPYEQALAFKELGFDEPCLAFFWNTGKFYTTVEYPHSIEYHKQNQLGDYNYDSTSAPTYSQAFRWFRKEYKLHSHISLGISDEQDRSGLEYDEYIYVIEGLNGLDYDNYGESLFYKTPEEAELACLRKLIEIVKKD
jgi:hypothetical protein